MTDSEQALENLYQAAQASCHNGRDTDHSKLDQLYHDYEAIRDSLNKADDFDELHEDYKEYRKACDECNDNSSRAVARSAFTIICAAIFSEYQ